MTTKQQLEKAIENGSYPIRIHYKDEVAYEDTGITIIYKDKIDTGGCVREYKGKYIDKDGDMFFWGSYDCLSKPIEMILLDDIQSIETGEKK